MTCVCVFIQNGDTSLSLALENNHTGLVKLLVPLVLQSKNVTIAGLRDELTVSSRRLSEADALADQRGSRVAELEQTVRSQADTIARLQADVQAGISSYNTLLSSVRSPAKSSSGAARILKSPGESPGVVPPTPTRIEQSPVVTYQINTAIANAKIPVRDAPSTSGGVIDYLSAGEVITVFSKPILTFYQFVGKPVSLVLSALRVVNTLNLCNSPHFIISPLL